MTLLFEAFILQLGIHRPVNVISKITGESNYKLWNILGSGVKEYLPNA